MGLDRDTVRKLRGLIIFTVVVAVLGVNYRRVLGVCGTILGMLMPFLVGSAIAFILNVPMRWLERRMNRKKRCSGSRAVSLILAILLVLGIVVVVLVVVVPELFRTFSGLQRSLPQFLAQTQDRLEQLFVQYPDILACVERVQIDWEQLMQDMMAFIRSEAGSVLNTTFAAVQGIASGVTSFGIGFIFAVYILLQKENLGRQCRKVLYAFLAPAAAERIIRISKLAESTFSSFLTGQCVEAVILGAMFFVTLTFLRMPYALLIGVLIGFTALIPMFGAFIGCAVGVFLILMVNPVQALVFIGVFLVLQQIEGNLIYPHVVGNSVGLPSIWVLVAVTLGGSMMGVLGMLVFIPLVSVLYALLREEVNRRLDERKIREAQ